MPDKFIYTPEELLTWLEENTCSEDHVTVDCVAVFVHGCFWHGHDCPKGRRPTTNVKFWNDKLHENRERDRRKKAELEQLGWRVITVWECETKDPAELSSRLEDTIRGGEQ